MGKITEFMKKYIIFLLLILLLAACGGQSDTTPASSMDNDVSVVESDAHSDANGLDTSFFFEGALAEDISIQDCTLSDGTETTCYEITIAGYPSNYDVGPFCPETTSDSADNGGIWFDGNGVYDVDGAFILGLSSLYNDSNWKLYDDNGNVNVTDSPEAFDAAARPNVDPAYQNHCVEGRIEWLDNGEPVPTTVLIPTTPVVGASATQARGNLGVTLNGVIMAPSAPVQNILGAYTIAAFDDCGGHINPVDGYHLHGARGCSELGAVAGGETPIFAYALDGYAIHSPLDPADEAAAGLDECQGHTTEAHGYHYHAASADKNAILSCFKGVIVEATAGSPGGGGPGGGPGDGGPGDGGPGGGGPGSAPGGPPDFAAAAAQLGISEQALMDALGTPPPDFEAAAATLGITVEALQDALGPPPR